MGNYLPSTSGQRQEMLEAIGLADINELFGAVPKHLLLTDGPDIPAGVSELELWRKMQDIAAKNTVYKTIFRGAGAYSHYIPAAVGAAVNKETFVTAYTPYQAEISQGILQSIFEFQTMICELCGMDSANASVYDGATAAAEALAICHTRSRTKALVSAASNPDVIDTMRSYCWAADVEMELIPEKDGATDLDVLAEMLDSSIAGVYIPQTGYYGIIEDVEKAAEITHAAGAKLIVGVNPIASGVLKSAGECGADIAVGEGQPLGMPIAFGGPYVGFMACTTSLTRSLPGRIVGETVDSDGRRAFVLTLQAREQHIRREKAKSNICTNQALCAMTAAAYLAVMGPQGLYDVAVQCMSKAHYLAEQLGNIPGFERVHSGEFFHEFVTRCPIPPDLLSAQLEAHGILGGLPVEEGILWCATELNTKEDIDQLIGVIREVLSR